MLATPPLSVSVFVYSAVVSMATKTEKKKTQQFVQVLKIIMHLGRGGGYLFPFTQRKFV